MLFRSVSQSRYLKKKIRKSIYITKPISDYKNFNFPTFFTTTDTLRTKDWIIYNPTNKKDETLIDEEAMKTNNPMEAQKANFNFHNAYRWDIECVIKSDAIFMLPGWEASPGARGEHAVAVKMQRHHPDYEIIYA